MRPSPDSIIMTFLLTLFFPALRLVSSGLAQDVDPDQIQDLYGHSVQVAEEIRKRVPFASKPIFDLGEVHQRFGFDDRAIETYREGLRMDPKRPDILSKIGFLISQRDPEEALKAYRKALEYNPRYPNARTRIGLIYQHQGRLEEAVEVFRAEIQNRSGNAVTYLVLGQVLKDLRMFPEAVLSLQEAKQLNPKDRMAYYGLSQVYKLQGRREESLKALEKFEELKTQDDIHADEVTTKGGNRPEQLKWTAMTYLDAAQTYVDVKMEEEAVRMLRRAILFDPSLSEVRRVLAEILWKSGKVDDALRESLKYLSEKRTAESLFLCAGLCTEKNLFRQAGEYLEESIRLDPRDGGPYRELARLILTKRVPGELSRAQELARLATEKSPTAAGNYDVYSWSLYQGGNSLGAFEALSIAARLDPGNESIRNRLERIRGELEKEPAGRNR